MIKGEIEVESGAMRGAVTDELDRSSPLGAYASEGRVRYLFIEERGIQVLSTRVDPAQPIAAVSGQCPGLSWDEREMADEYLIAFDALPDPRPFRPINGELAPAVIASGSGVTQVVVGPVHAGIIEPGRFTFSSGGETIAHLDFQIGFSYRGLERSFEGADPLELARRVARICGACSASRSLAYAMAVESISDTPIADPVHIARQIIAELERIYNHVFDLSVCCAAVGWGFGHASGLALKERALRICEAATGHRLLFDAIVPGGVGQRVLQDRQELQSMLLGLEEAVEQYVSALFDNTSVVSRWTGDDLVRCGPRFSSRWTRSSGVGRGSRHPRHGTVWSVPLAPDRNGKGRHRRRARTLPREGGGTTGFVSSHQRCIRSSRLK
jgi:hypothetical protein